MGEGPISSVTEPQLVRMMVGRSGRPGLPKREVAIGEVTLKVDGPLERHRYADVSFELRKGEILGLYGLVGAGRTEAMQGLFGISPTTRGTVSLNGRTLAIRSPADAIAAGISSVPEDRQDQGAILSLGIRENITLANLLKHVRGLFLSRSSEQAETRLLGGRWPSRRRTGSSGSASFPAATSRRW